MRIKKSSINNNKIVITLMGAFVFLFLATNPGACSARFTENNPFTKTMVEILKRDSILMVIIKGRIVDYKDKAPLYWANLTIKGTTILIKVDSTGKFLLKFDSSDLPLHYSDNIVLVVHCLGYDEQEIPITLLKKKKMYVIQMKHDELWYTGE